jgi:hypothetical protein
MQMFFFICDEDDKELTQNIMFCIIAKDFKLLELLQEEQALRCWEVTKLIDYL